MKTILIAVSGMSPAIITETLWALAGETPPVVPNEVVVITTAKGEEDIQKMLLTPEKEWGGKKVWEVLRKDLFARAKMPRDSRHLQLALRVIDLPDDSGIKVKAPDLRTKEHNSEAADFILQIVGSFTDEPDHHVIASIAGGRKTMGALLYACMSLVGKETDLVTHVLVSEPFEFVKGFFYPEQPVQDLTYGPKEAPKKVRAKDARIDMAEVDFVPLRNRFHELNEPKRSFAGLVKRYARELRRPLSGPPSVSMDVKNEILEVEGRPIHLTGRDLLVACFLYERAKAGQPHFPDRDRAAAALPAFLKQWKAKYPSHHATARLSGDLSEDDVTKALSSFRGKLKDGLSECIPYLAPPNDRIGFDLRIS